MAALSGAALAGFSALWETVLLSLPDAQLSRLSSYDWHGGMSGWSDWPDPDDDELDGYQEHPSIPARSATPFVLRWSVPAQDRGHTSKWSAAP